MSAKTENVEVKVLVELGSPEEGQHFEEFTISTDPTNVVLDIIHEIQAVQKPDLAVRWNCKAGKCGSCSAEE